MEENVMKVVITIDDIRAYTEVNYIINHMNEKYIEMIPKKLLNFFNDLSDSNYKVSINPHIPLENQGLQRYTLEIIAILHLKYWCQDEKRKQELYNIMMENNGGGLDNHFKYRENIESLFSAYDDDKNVRRVENNNVDYSTPKKLQKININNSENDENIDENSDFVDEDKLPLESKSVQNEKKGIFAKIKELITTLFKK